MLIIMLRVAVVVRDRATEADAQLCAQLRFDQAIGAKRLLGVVMTEIGFAASGCNPYGGESGSATTGLRRGELLDGGPQALADQRNRR